MPDRIFYQRLQQQAWDQSIQRRWREIHFNGQPVLESDSLDVEIKVDQLHLAPQRNFLKNSYPSTSSPPKLDSADKAG